MIFNWLSRKRHFLPLAADLSNLLQTLDMLEKNQSYAIELAKDGQWTIVSIGDMARVYARLPSISSANVCDQRRRVESHQVL